MFVESIISAVLFGAVVGGAITYAVAIDPIRRSRDELRHRLVRQNLHAYMAQWKDDAYRVYEQPAEPDIYSKKVKSLRSVS